MNQRPFPTPLNIAAGLMLFTGWIAGPLLLPGFLKAQRPDVTLPAPITTLLHTAAGTGAACCVCFIAAVVLRKRMLFVVPAALGFCSLALAAMRLPSGLRLPQEANPADVRRLESLHVPQAGRGDAAAPGAR